MAFWMSCTLSGEVGSGIVLKRDRKEERGQVKMRRASKQPVNIFLKGGSALNIRFLFLSRASLPNIRYVFPACREFTG